MNLGHQLRKLLYGDERWYRYLVRRAAKDRAAYRPSAPWPTITANPGTVAVDDSTPRPAGRRPCALPQQVTATPALQAEVEELAKAFQQSWRTRDQFADKVREVREQAARGTPPRTGSLKASWLKGAAATNRAILRTFGTPNPILGRCHACGEPHDRCVSCYEHQRRSGSR